MTVTAAQIAAIEADVSTAQTDLAAAQTALAEVSTALGGIGTVLSELEDDRVPEVTSLIEDLKSGKLVVETGNYGPVIKEAIPA